MLAQNRITVPTKIDDKIRSVPKRSRNYAAAGLLTVKVLSRAVPVTRLSGPSSKKSNRASSQKNNWRQQSRHRHPRVHGVK